MTGVFFLLKQDDRAAAGAAIENTETSWKLLAGRPRSVPATNHPAVASSATSSATAPMNSANSVRDIVHTAAYHLVMPCRQRGGLMCSRCSDAGANAARLRLRHRSEATAPTFELGSERRSRPAPTAGGADEVVVGAMPASGRMPQQLLT